MRWPRYRKEPSGSAMDPSLFEPLPGPPDAHRGEHGTRCRRPVERVEVDPRRAARQELLALARCVGHAQLGLGVLIAPKGVHGLSERLRDRGVAQLAKANDLGVACDWAHPGNALAV